MVKFCELCGTVLRPKTDLGSLKFRCISCENIYESDESDTLMATGHIEDTTHLDLKYEVFVENSPHDPTNKLISKECPNCKKNYMTMIRIGVDEKILYTCDCGYSINK